MSVTTELSDQAAATVVEFSHRTFSMLVDGELVDGPRHVDVLDPGTGKKFAVGPVADENQVNQAVEAARRAFDTWRNVPVEERAEVLLKLADAIEARAEEIARLITLEMGKIIGESRMEVADAVAFTRHFATWRGEDKVLRNDDRSYIVQRHRPLGVVAAIVPWNFPFHQAVYKLAPALITGNTVVVKPAPTTPLNAMLLAELLAAIVPAGVANVVGDDGAVGPQLTSHPDVAKVSFTGSTAVGKSVLRSSADTIKKVTLELGGNDALIVLDDVDVARTARRVFTVSFWNAGQVCMSAKRLYVQAGIYDEFCAALAAAADAAAVGHGLDEDSRIGPVQNAKQFDVAKGVLARAAQDGTVIAGGHAVDGDGYFVEPTIVRDIDESSPIVSEETFGPIRSVLSFDTVDEAVRRANDTVYGLGASVWSSDADRAWQVAARLDAGTVWINRHINVYYDVPFGGHKQSGLGVEFGDEGILGFTDLQVINKGK